MSEDINISVPDIGDFDGVPVIEILVKVGDEVQAEDSLITLESDKATMDVPSPVAGTIQSISVKEGDEVKQGDAIAVLSPAEANETNEAAAPAEIAQEAPSEDKAKDKSSKAAPAAAIIDDKADTAPETNRIKAFREAHKKAPPVAPPPGQRAGIATVHASPSIRRYARLLGADLTQVRGSGPKGRILKTDVKTWISLQLSKLNAGQESGGMGIPAMPEIDFSEFGEIEIEPFSRIQKLSAPHLHRAWLNVPHVTHHDEADITETEAFRQSLKKEYADKGTRITLLSFIMKAVVGSLKKFPHFNASISPDGTSYILKKYFNIGVAVDTPKGLVVPVIRDVDRLSIQEISEALTDLSGRAREGKLKGHEMKGGCMSISSLGGIGGTAFTPIVNAPEVAILGITRSKMQPVWNGTEFEPRLMLPLDLSYDHRAIDGAEAARFMAYLVSLFVDVRRLLL